MSSPLYRHTPSNLLVETASGAVVHMKTVVVSQDEERARGLMHVKHLPINLSMLFYFPHSQVRSFWMKNTLIALDLWFVDANGVIQNIHHNAQPLNTEPISSATPTRVVIEVNGGLSQRLNITPGAVVRHGSFGNAKLSAED